MLENIDRIKERIQTLNNGFKSLNNFSETKKGELFGKIMQMKLKTASSPEPNDTQEKETDKKPSETQNLVKNLNDLLTLQYLNSNSQLNGIQGLSGMNTILSGINKKQE